VSRPSSSGRARRLWLEGRLARSRRAFDLLDRKRTLLAQEERRLAARRIEAEREWKEAAADVRRWATRANALSGAWSVALVASELEGLADVTVAPERTVGVNRPGSATVIIPAPSDQATVAAGPAMRGAVSAHRRAVEVAAAHSVAAEAYRIIRAELRLTERRQRAIETIRIPALEAELRELVLRLDELERQERIVGVWASRQNSRR
jgi:V/A-type H+/Na+-transporting ATPase subunit D